VDWEQNKDKPEEDRRQGLDLRGAELSGQDLSSVPLARMTGSFVDDMSRNHSDRQVNHAAAQMKGVNLSGAQLIGATLFRAHLEGADLTGAHLTHATIYQTELTDANLSWAQLIDAVPSEAYLIDTILHEAQLTGADLGSAHVEGANLSYARLERADLGGARLEGADLSKANLERADLRRASFDKATQLHDAILHFASLDQTIFDNTNLSVVRWQDVPILGAELRARSTGGFEPRGTSRSRGERRHGRMACNWNQRIASHTISAPPSGCGHRLSCPEGS
jgi:uncharacterized protein YjbI with pentapeptide repeats